MNQLVTNISGKECGHLSCLQLQQSKQEKQKEGMNLTQFLCSILKFSVIFSLFVANAESGKKQEQQIILGYGTNNPLLCVCSKLNFLTMHLGQSQFGDYLSISQKFSNIEP